MKKRLMYNIISSLVLEIVTVICGFILPRMIITGFGSEYNGVVSSVTQFLSVITLLRSGVGGVTKAALYKPLVENDIDRISAIVNATERFMRKIAYIFISFLMLFAVVYPLLVSKEFEWFYTFTLVLILGISTISQYYFGITYQFLLSADQKSYVYYILQTIATALNTLFSVILIKNGVEFRVMKLISSLVFAAIPIVFYWYVHRNYTIIKSTPRDDDCIKQRWDAFVHQVSSFIHNNTDLVLLTVFSNLYQVSIYSIYNMVVCGVKKFVLVFTSGIEATIGRLIATNKEEQLVLFIGIYEWSINVVSVIAFGCTAILIVPFMKMYTVSIVDANYIQPVLGYWLTIGAFLSCIRLPYQGVVESAGHFKETRNGAIIEAALNIIVSLVLVVPFGAVGVAIGTAVAMLFRAMQYAVYSYRHIINKDPMHIIGRIVITAINIFIIFFFYDVFEIDMILFEKTNSYLFWIAEACTVFIAIVVITVLVNVIAYRKIIFNIVDFVIRNKKI